jgi:serine/threonine-protein kinase HipA
MAGKARLPEKLVLDAAGETVARFHASWQAEKKNLALSKGLIETIERHVGTVPIASE